MKSLSFLVVMLLSACAAAPNTPPVQATNAIGFGNIKATSAIQFGAIPVMSGNFAAIPSGAAGGAAAAAE